MTRCRQPPQSGGNRRAKDAGCHPHLGWRQLGGNLVAPLHASHFVARHGSGEPAIAAISTQQHGLITIPQLGAVGVSAGLASARCRRGILHRVHTGVYRVGHESPLELADLLAAVLACGPTAVLSHRAAAYLWGLLPALDQNIDVTVLGNRRHRPGIRVHRSRSIERRDLRGRARIPVTAPAGTLLGVAATADLRTLESALDEARIRKLITDDDLEALRARTSGAAGWSALNTLLESERGPGFSRSEAERRMLALIRSAGLPEPRRNARIHGFEVDFLWPDLQLVVEVDGYTYHSGRASFERDRARRAELGTIGIEAIPFTWRQVDGRPHWVVAQLAGAIAQRVTRRPRP